jgi:hypothetical protein
VTLTLTADGLPQLHHVSAAEGSQENSSGRPPRGRYDGWMGPGRRPSPSRRSLAHADFEIRPTKNSSDGNPAQVGRRRGPAAERPRPEFLAAFLPGPIGGIMEAMSVRLQKITGEANRCTAMHFTRQDGPSQTGSTKALKDFLPPAFPRPIFSGKSISLSI